jgi:hypothetical protein
LRGRPITEVILLAFTVTVCLVLLLTSGAIAFLEIRDNTIDTGDIQEQLNGIIQVLVGAILGFLARGGKTIDDKE